MTQKTAENAVAAIFRSAVKTSVRKGSGGYAEMDVTYKIGGRDLSFGLNGWYDFDEMVFGRNWKYGLKDYVGEGGRNRRNRRSMFLSDDRLDEDAAKAIEKDLAAAGWLSRCGSEEELLLTLACMGKET